MLSSFSFLLSMSHGGLPSNLYSHKRDEPCSVTVVAQKTLPKLERKRRSDTKSKWVGVGTSKLEAKNVLYICRISARVHLHLYVCLCACARACARTLMHVCECARVCVCACICVCARACVCMCVCVWACCHSQLHHHHAHHPS